MAIKKIKKIKDYGLYKDFSWNCENFKRYNGIYGFNGSGKSTLALIIKSLNTGMLFERERGSVVEIELDDGTQIFLNEDREINKVFCFDEYFLQENFKWGEGINTFVVIGKKSAEDEEKLKKFHAQSSEILIEKKLKEKEIEALKTMIDDSGTDVAAELKATLVTFDPSKYGSFRRNNLSTDISRLGQGVLDNAEENFSAVTGYLNELRQTSIPDVIYTLDDHAKYEDILNMALSFLQKPYPFQNKNTFSSVELAWIENGVTIHEHKVDCLYCGGTITNDRKDEITKIINDEYSSFIREGNLAIQRIDQSNMKPFSLMAKDFYPEFQERITSINTLFELLNKELEDLKSKLKEQLEIKVQFLFQEKNFDTHVVAERVKSLFESYASFKYEVKAIAEENKSKSGKIEEIRRTAKSKVEHYFYKKYRDKVSVHEENMSKKNEELDKIIKSAHEIKTEIDKISKELESEAQAIVGINKMLHIFLGRNDLSLEFNSTRNRFEVKRKTSVVKRLSEGEKTAISICYFLILVNANQEVRNQSIVLLDDPITSLDSNNIYNAYSVIKENLKDVKQLFILTHNLVFFRLITRLLSDFKENVYFNLSTSLNREIPQTQLETLSKGSKESSTEYILLYAHLKKFLKLSEAQINDLKDYDFLPYPNMLRRFLEAYIYSKEPGASSSDYETPLIKYGMKADVAQIANRFSNDFSHTRFDAIYGNDLTSLSNTPEILKKVIEELERIDSVHFNSMSEYID